MIYRHGITIQKRKRKKPYLVRWKGDFNFKTGSYIRPGKSFIREKDARNFADQLQDELDKGLNLNNKDITIGELCDKFLTWKKETVKYTTYQRYEQSVNQFLKYFHPTVRARQIEQENCERFLNEVGFLSPNHQKRKKKIAEFTRHQYYRNLKTLFTKAVKWKYLNSSPFEDITMSAPSDKAWHFLTPEEFGSLINFIEKIPESKKNPEKHILRSLRLSAFYHLLYGTGIRFGEGISLLWDKKSLDLDNHIVNLTNREGRPDMPPFNIKDHESRSIRIPDNVIEVLEKLKQADGMSSPFVFLSKEQWERVLNKWKSYQAQGIEGKWSSKDMMGSALRDFKRYCKQAGIQTTDKLNIHCLRKAFCTNHAVNLGIPSRTLKEIVGHSSSTTTEKFYIQDIDANKQKAVEGMDRLMREGKKGCSQLATTAIDYSI